MPKSSSHHSDDDSSKKGSSEENIAVQLEVPPETRSKRSSSPSKLSPSLTLKARTQRSRITCLTRLLMELPEDVEDFTTEELNVISQQIEETHKSFLKEHAYLEVSWPTSCLDHEYFSKDMHTEENFSYMTARLRIGKLKAALVNKARSTTTAQSVDTAQSSSSRLPDITLPCFKGEYTAWPEFRDLFKGMILDNERLTNMERLHYLRTSVQGAPAKLIAGLPISGDSLTPSWEMLTERYENKRLFIENYLDQLFPQSSPVPRKASALGDLMSSVKESLKALQSLGVSECLWEYSIVHQVSRQLDKHTREQWETSLGAHQDYPSFQQLEEFLMTKMRALERVEKISSQTAQQPSYAKVSAAQHPRPALSVCSSASTSSTAITPAAIAKAATEYPCDCCGGAHFIVLCSKFRDMSAPDRFTFVVHRRLCYNCLGRHNVRSCRSRSALGCKKCSGRHHTMLHDSQREYVEAQKAAQPSKSTSSSAH